jgi:hypothetical protein
MNNNQKFTVSEQTAALAELVREAHNLYKRIGDTLSAMPDEIVGEWESTLEEKFLDPFSIIRCELGMLIGDSVNNNLYDPQNTEI